MSQFRSSWHPAQHSRKRRWRIDAVTRQRQRYDDDDLTTPRCPRCRYYLIARVGRGGPYFYCLCGETKKAAPTRRRLSGER